MLVLTSPTYGQTDDMKFAEMLIEGMRSSRMSISSGKIKYNVQLFLPTEEGTLEVTGQLAIEWTGDSRWSHFNYTDADGTEHNQLLIRHDGVLLINTETEDAYKNVVDTDEHSIMSFDPRLLGLVSEPHQKSTLQSNLFSPKRLAPKLIARDVNVGGTTTQHVSWAIESNRPDGQPAMYYFIENSSGFPVHEVWGWSTDNRWRSFYENNEKLPTRVERYSVGESGVETKLEVFEVLEQELYVEVPDETMELNNLGLTIGQSVIDEQAMMIIGYWNGKKLNDSKSAAFAQASASGAFKESNGNSWGWKIGMALFMAALVSWFVLRKSGAA